MSVSLSHFVFLSLPHYLTPSLSLSVSLCIYMSLSHSLCLLVSLPLPLSLCLSRFLCYLSLSVCFSLVLFLRIHHYHREFTTSLVVQAAVCVLHLLEVGTCFLKMTSGHSFPLSHPAPRWLHVAHTSPFSATVLSTCNFF